MSNKITTKATKEIGIADRTLKKDQRLLNMVNETKTKLLQEAEVKKQSFNELKIPFGTKADLYKVMNYLYHYAQWDSKDVVHLETTYNSFVEAYNNAKNDTDAIIVDYLSVDCLYKHLEKEKSTDDYRSRGVKGTILPIFKYDENNKLKLDENNVPIINGTLSIAHLKMLVIKANQETMVTRLEFQSISEQVKMCDMYLQQIAINQKPAEPLEDALKQIQEKFKELIKKENEKDGK